MQKINTRRVQKELSVLRVLVAALQALVPGDEKSRRSATFCGNPNNPALTAFSIGRVTLDKIGDFVSKLHAQLALDEIGVMLDAVVLKPVIYKSAEDVRNQSLKKTMFVNLSLCKWTRERVMQAVASQCPNDKYYDIDVLPAILDQLDSDIEVVEFEQNCEGVEYPRKNRKQDKRFRSPLISAEQAMAVMRSLGIEGAAKELLPALGFVAKAKVEKKQEDNAQG